MLSVGGACCVSFQAIPKVSVIVPVYNEEESLPAFLARLKMVLDENSEVLFVDDGSTDSTFRILKGVREDKVRILQHRRNLGKGAAIMTALNHCRGNIVVIQDADLEYDPGQIPDLVTPIIDGRADVIFGSRFLDGYPPGMSFAHYIGNRTLSSAASIIFGVRLTDVMTGHKAFKRDLLSSDILKSRGFDFEIEMAFSLTRCGDGRFAEVPVSYSKRNNGQAKIRKRDGIRAFARIFTCLLRTGRSWHSIESTPPFT